MRRIAAWLRPDTLIVLAVYLISLYAVFRTAEAFVPDSRYYAAMALRFSGHSVQETIDAISAQIAPYGWDTPPEDQLFGWGLVAPRIVFPLLSTPFVAVWGIPGLQVVPVVAMGVGFATVMRLGRGVVGGGMTLAASLLLAVSSRMVFFGGAMLTESLAFALVAAMAMCLPWDGAPRSRKALAVSLALLLVLAFTRQTTLVPAGAAAVAWFFSAIKERTARTSWAPFALWWVVGAVGLQTLQAVLWPGFSQLDQFLRVTGANSLAGALWKSPGVAWKVITSDVNVMLSKDHQLLALLALAVVAGVVRWRHADAHLLIGALSATFVYNVTNGTPTTFRYGMPGLVFVVMAVALLLRSAVEQRLVAPSAVDPGPPEEEVDHSVDDHRDGLRDHEAETQSGQ